MLKDVYPLLHYRYSALPILGSALDGYSSWLSAHGYRRNVVRLHVRTSRRLDEGLRRRGCQSIRQISREDLRACCPQKPREDIGLFSVVGLWERYLDEQEILPKPEPTRIQQLTTEYSKYLQNVRGSSASTLRQHCWTASRFLMHVEYDARPSHLSDIDGNDIETYVRMRGQRVNRPSLQHEIAHLRSFLRFLAARGEMKPGLDTQIDTPRLYRGEQLPRALPWVTVPFGVTRELSRRGPESVFMFAARGRTEIVVRRNVGTESSAINGLRRVPIIRYVPKSISNANGFKSRLQALEYNAVDQKVRGAPSDTETKGKGQEQVIINRQEESRTWTTNCARLVRHGN